MPRLIVLLLTLTFSMAYGQELPPIYNFPPETYQGETQNWAICQSGDNNIYIANNKGLIEYNGASWKLYPTPNHTIMRSVNVQENKIYTGCYMEFGYWQKDKFQNLEYTSLSEKIKDKLQKDEQFWKIVFYHQWILFQSLHSIYIYDKEKDSYQIITSIPNLTKIFKVNDQLYFQKKDVGIFELENGQPKLVSGATLFQENIIINIFPYFDKLLVETQDKGFFSLKNGIVDKWQTGSSAILDKLSVYSSLQLNDGSFILGTIDNGIFHLSSEGEILEHINKTKGLQNNTILSIFQDSYNNVWLGLDNGISVINRNSFFKIFNDINGNLGSIYTASLHNGYLYLGTNQGLFAKRFGVPGEFELIENTKGQVWNLKVIRGELFCCHNSGTFLINGNKASLISHVLGSWDIKTVDNNNLLIQGNFEGLHILEKINNHWQYRNKIEGFDVSCRYFEILPDNQIFINHEYQGIIRLKVAADFRKVEKVSFETSAPRSFKSSIATYNGKLFYFGDSGFYIYDQQKKQFQKDTLLTRLAFINDSYSSGKLINDEGQRLWAFTNRNILMFSKGLIDNNLTVTHIPLPFSLRNNVVGYENILSLNHDTYLTGSTSGYILFDLNKIIEEKYPVLINSVLKSRIDGITQPVPYSEKSYRFDSNENNISFKFNLPAYCSFFQTLYQYKLEGLYNKWSSWSEDPIAAFKNLPPGNYTFKVRGKIGNNISSNVASYSFSIAYPWYLSMWAIIFYFLFFMALVASINYIYKLRYRRQEQKIECEKQKELLMLQIENEANLIKLRNENLKNEIETKSQELVTSAMSIIKKNELLNQIELELKQKNPNVVSALKIIEDNLNGNSDWEVFQEAFNKTDRDFLKKLKETHPALTPNDLKLCVYLRLNLSSKEIAPMLNISSQSVEIKRFRLRKKMELDHEQNLTEYILNL